MKKTILIILAVVLMLFAFCAVVSAAEKTKADYYHDIQECLRILEEALKSGNAAKINQARKALLRAVYAAERYLASVHEYDPRLEDVLKLASTALVSKEFSEVITDAQELTTDIFENGTNPVTTTRPVQNNNEGSSHS